MILLLLLLLLWLMFLHLLVLRLQKYLLVLTMNSVVVFLFRSENQLMVVNHQFLVYSFYENQLQQVLTVYVLHLNQFLLMMMMLVGLLLVFINIFPFLPLFLLILHLSSHLHPYPLAHKLLQVLKNRLKLWALHLLMFLIVAQHFLTALVLNFLCSVFFLLL